MIPEKMRTFYGTEDYDWNHYKLLMGNAYDFQTRNFS